MSKEERFVEQLSSGITTILNEELGRKLAICITIPRDITWKECLWGYIAVNEAKDKVLGTYFYHESETAGLGARIGEKWFQDQFIGKPIFGEDGNVALTVTKAGAAQSEFEVDGVTGATLTSNGVAAMVKDGLAAYKEFLGGAASECPNKGKCQKEGGCQAEAECTCPVGECEETNVEQ